MRRSVWPNVGLHLAMALTVLSATSVAEESKPLKTEAHPAYRVLGDLAIMDRGRVKPLHTVAIERVKLIHSRQAIKLTDAEGKTVATWGPVAALLDWSVRPEFWNDQEFILVEYLPLKRMIFAGPVKERLETIAGRESTPKATRDAVNELAGRAEFDEADLAGVLALQGLTEEDRAELARLAHKLAADTKYLAPSDLEDAQVNVHEGHADSFLDWFGEILSKQDGAGARSGMSGATAKLTPLEQKVDEVGKRFLYYQAIRDRNPRGAEALDLDVLPRPNNAEYLAYTAEAMKTFEGPQGVAGLTPLQLDAIRVLSSYYETLQRKDRMPPGPFDPALLGEEAETADEAKRRELEARQTEFNERFAAWLRDKADWVPLRVVLDAEVDELARAGFPSDKIEAFRTSYAAVEKSERENPGKLPREAAQSLIASARDLGATIGGYPSEPALARESHFNRFAPFYKAPMAYGLAFFLLLIVLGITTDQADSRSRLRSILYAVGLTGFVAGILLEIYGFYLRVLISGWAPVTNMYETVIWVALITAIIGLVLELIYRRVYAALAASGVALLATILAANVSLLDPTIGSLQPVLRSNYWLTIHVLTIVSSYAAFALALGLGLLATGFYLTANYRGRATFAELAAPLVPGVPLAAVGILGIYGSYHGWLPSLLGHDPGFYATSIVAAVGGVLTIAAVFGLFGELANRRPSVAVALGLAALVPGVIGVAADQFELGPAWLIGTAGAYASWTVAVVGMMWVMLGFFGGLAGATLRAADAQLASLDDASVGSEDEEDASEYATADAAAIRSNVIDGNGQGGVATVARPTTVAEIRERIAAGRPKPDALGLSIQATAARIKPLSNFIYRAMQVGVLLCAAGTILGGVWADYSWGRFWGWDPKEVWALITLLVYLVPLHGRFAGWVNTFGLVVASVVCFLSVLMAWYGVNFVLGVGLHSYGFVEGGGQGIVMAISLAVLAVVVGAGWRRNLSSRPALES